MADWTIIRVLEWTQSYFTSRFQEHSQGQETLPRPATRVDSPRLTAEILLAHTLGLERLDLYLQHDRPLEAGELSRFKSLIRRRAAGEPVAYLTGEKGFYESDFRVGKGVLIPRPDTETLVEEALAVMADRSGLKVLDLGTGSGAIIVSLAKAAPDHRYFALDLSVKALQTAALNSRCLADGRVHFFAASWFEALAPASRFDLILSNPPYIRTGDIDGLAPEIRAHEPLLALDGGADGFDAYRVLLGGAAGVLAPGGTLLMEMGADQKAGMQALAAEAGGYDMPEFISDLAGHDRVVKIKKIID